jgi:hypothetical protein
MLEENIKTKITRGLSGVAGEYFVAAELSRRGFIATLTLKNTRGVDILVSNADAKRSAGIQVKTNQGSKKIWVLTSKSEEFHADNLFCVFFNLHGPSVMPEFHVVPSKVVASTIKDGHQAWLRTPGKKGQKRNDNNMRNFHDPKSEYLNRWDLLSLE